MDSSSANNGSQQSFAYAIPTGIPGAHTQSSGPVGMNLNGIGLSNSISPPPVNSADPSSMGLSMMPVPSGTGSAGAGSSGAGSSGASSSSSDPMVDYRISRPRSRRSAHCRRWTAEQDEQLRLAVQMHGARNWKRIGAELGNIFTADQCNQHWHRVLNPQITKGDWTLQEDMLLQSLVDRYGESSWIRVAKEMGSARTDIQCRHRYFQRKRDGHVDRLGDPHGLVVGGMGAAGDGSVAGVPGVNGDDQDDDVSGHHGHHHHGHHQQQNPDGSMDTSVLGNGTEDDATMSARKRALSQHSQMPSAMSSISLGVGAPHAQPGSLSISTPTTEFHVSSRIIHGDLTEYKFPLSISEQDVLASEMRAMPHPVSVEVFDRILQRHRRFFLPFRSAQGLKKFYDMLVYLNNFHPLVPGNVAAAFSRSFIPAQLGQNGEFVGPTSTSTITFIPFMAALGSALTPFGPSSVSALSAVVGTANGSAAAAAAAASTPSSTKKGRRGRRRANDDDDSDDQEEEGAPVVPSESKTVGGASGRKRGRKPKMSVDDSEAHDLLVSLASGKDGEAAVPDSGKRKRAIKKADDDDSGMIVEYDDAKEADDAASEDGDEEDAESDDEDAGSKRKRRRVAAPAAVEDEAGPKRRRKAEPAKEFELEALPESMASQLSQSGAPVGETLFYLYLDSSEETKKTALSPLPKPLIKAKLRLTIDQLIQWIKFTLNVDKKTQIEILHHSEVLTSDLSFSQILRRFKKPRQTAGGILRLYFRTAGGK
eukprot:ANDGO_01381.mRNA.1 Myb-like protein M